MAFSASRLSVLLLAALVLMTAVLPAMAQDVLRLENATKRYTVDSLYTYIVDPGGELTIKDVVQIPDKAFKPFTGTAISNSFRNDPHWFKLVLHYDFNHQIESRILPWTLEISYAALDYIDYYFPDKFGNYQVLQSGDRRPFEVRPADFNYHLFPLDLRGNETITIYLRVQTTSYFQLPSTIYSPTVLFSTRTLSRFLYGFYFGIIVIMALYNLFLYATLRDSNYIYYVCYIIAYGLLLASISGISFQYLWPSASDWANRSVPFLMFVSIMFAALFTRKFLATQTHSRGTDKILLTLASLAAILGAYSLFAAYQPALAAAVVVTALTTFVIIIAGTGAVIKGYPGSRFFLLGWTALLIGVCAFALMAAGIAPRNFLTAHGGEIGSSVEVIFLSLALADRVRNLRAEKQHLENQSQDSLRQSNAELSQALHLVAESNQLKDNFLAQVSHELRTPLNGIMGSVELMQLEELPERVREYADSAELSTNHMLNLVSSLLDFSESQATLDTHQHLIELRKIVIDLGNDHAAEMRRKGLAFNLNIREDVPSLLLGDERKLRLILRHIMSNAIKFTHEGGIDISVIPQLLALPESRMRFLIEDTGSGIPTEELEQIFEPFHQADSSRARKHGGLGIGLSICRQLASQMRGEIQAEVSATGGTRIVLELPFSIPEDS